MGKYLTRKIIAALLSDVVFCLFLAGVWMNRPCMLYCTAPQPD